MFSLKANCNKVLFKNKGCRFIAGLLIYFPLLYLFDIVIAVYSTILIAFLKEVFESIYSKTEFDIYDILATTTLPMIISLFYAQ